MMRCRPLLRLQGAMPISTLGLGCADAHPWGPVISDQSTVIHRQRAAGDAL